MRSRLAWVALLLGSLAVTPAAAQQKILTPEERITAAIGQLVLQNAQLGYQVDQLQQQLATTQARVKELEANPVPRAPAPNSGAPAPN